MKVIIQFLLLIIVKLAIGQSTKSVTNIATADGILKSKSIHTFSIGEPIISKISNSKTILTQGFLQPIGSYFLFANRDIIPCYTWKIWPNPAQEVVNVSIDQKSCFTVSKTVLRIIKANGELFITQDALEGTNVINSIQWAPGTYFVQIINNTGIQSTTKVIVMHP